MSDRGACNYKLKIMFVIQKIKDYEEAGEYGGESNAFLMN